MKFSFSHGLRLSMLCVMLVLAGCAGKKQRVSYDRHAFDSAIKDAASEYGVDAKLITAMIQVESGFNPAAVSKSNAIGLMQLKADTAGCDAYRYKGKRGCPDADDLRDPDTNIDLGAAYLATLQNSSLKDHEPCYAALRHHHRLRQRHRRAAAHLLQQPPAGHRDDQQPIAGSL